MERISRSTHPTTRPAFPGFLGWDQHHGLPGNRRMGAAREFLSKNAAAVRAKPMRPWAACFSANGENNLTAAPHGFRALENGVLVERSSRSTHPTTRPAFPGFLGWDQHHDLPSNRRMGAAREFLSKNAATERAEPMRPWAACFSANGENNLTAAPHGFRALENRVLVERISRSTHPCMVL